MSYVSATVYGKGISVDYSPARPLDADSDRMISASVHIELGCDRSHVYMSLSIEDARALLAALPGVLAEHDAAESGSVVDLAKKSAA